MRPIVTRPAAETAHLGEMLADLIRRHGVPAAQLAVHVNGRTTAVTAGRAGADAKFPVGSITKAFIRDADADWVGHDGTSCHLRIDSGHDRVVALTTNANTGSSLWDDLVEELRASGIPVGTYVPPDLKQRIPVNGEVYPELMLHDDWAFSVVQPASGLRILGGRFLKDSTTGRVSGLQTGGRVARRLKSLPS